jgi:hypothetical protein
MLGFAPVSVLPVSALPAVTANNYLISALNGTYALAGQSVAIVWSGGGPVTGPQQYFIEIRSFTERRSFC